MPAASILIKPVSSNCNIDCSYCFYKCLCHHREEYSKGLMSGENLEKLVSNAISYADHYLAFAFQGGEPMLAGLDFYRQAVLLQHKYRKNGLTIENTIQTNGTLINDAWAEFFAENHFLVGISLDGPKKLHDKYRGDCQGNGTFEHVMRGIEILKKWNVPFNIVSVITKDSVKKASYLYKFYKRNKFDFVQFIPCMEEDKRGNLKTDDETEEYVRSYGRFLCEIFDLWYADFVSGERMDIRMFSNLAQMAAGYPAEECGMNGHCSCYFVIEGDGSVYPCDFYCSDEWKLGTLEDSFLKMQQSEKTAAFLRTGQELFAGCPACPYYSLCRGGCRRWREVTQDRHNILCEAYKEFFSHSWKQLENLGLYIKKSMGCKDASRMLKLK